jgi:hypothetical protein
MSNSTSRAFKGIPHGFPIETGKTGETMSLPTVADYLKEICKEDNVDVDQYLANHTVKTIDTSLTSKCRNVRSIQQDSLLNPKMTYTFWDRLKSIWIAIKSLRYTSYNLFDFKTYDTVAGRWEYFNYSKVSTPWDRFKRFLKTQYREIKWAWNYTPEHIKHYNKNKERVDYFEDHNTDYFCGDGEAANDAKITLQNFGYTVKPNYVYYEPIPKDKDQTFL